MKIEKVNRDYFVQGECFNFAQAWGTIKKLDDGGLTLVMSVGDTVVVIGDPGDPLENRSRCFCDVGYNRNMKRYFDQRNNHFLRNWPPEAVTELEQLVGDHMQKRQGQTGRDLVDIEDLFRKVE